MSTKFLGDRSDLPSATWMVKRGIATRLSLNGCLALVALLFLTVSGGDVMAGGLVDTSVERFQAADFTNSAEITNPWWTLTAGRNFLYFADDGGDCVWNLTQVLNSTTDNFVAAYAGTHARVVLDREWVDEGCVFGLDFQAFMATNPDFEEVTYDWYAQDTEMNIWYMGENTFDGDGYEGSFTAGCDGAEAGIVVLGSPHKGDFYQQEFYEGEAEDWGKVLNLLKRGATRYMKTKEWTPLEPGAVEHKFYRSVGGIGELFMIEELKEKTVIVNLVAMNIDAPPANGLPISPTPSCPPFTQP